MIFPRSRSIQEFQTLSYTVVSSTCPGFIPLVMNGGYPPAVVEHTSCSNPLTAKLMKIIRFYLRKECFTIAIMVDQYLEF